jgi:hypothetical protein
VTAETKVFLERLERFGNISQIDEWGSYDESATYVFCALPAAEREIIERAERNAQHKQAVAAVAVV